MNKHFIRTASMLVAVSVLSASSSAQSVDEMQQRGIQFLEVTQAEDGSWTKPDAVGITGLVTTSLLMSGKSVGDPFVKKGLDFIVANQQAVGGILLMNVRMVNATLEDTSGRKNQVPADS